MTWEYAMWHQYGKERCNPWVYSRKSYENTFDTFNEFQSTIVKGTTKTFLTIVNELQRLQRNDICQNSIDTTSPVRRL